ncbi:MAG: NUDIX domain-containing protein [Actinomycetaceae bacterium]|nr:NUDIX domain-containing protein [Actinomycetaceae bacterium]
MLSSEHEWPIGPDGLPTRDAARIILIDEDDRALLVKGHDGSDPKHEWWFTVGGGREPGESAKAAAVRECFEETGYKLDEGALIGPVIYRDSKFYFADRTRRQKEYFFLAKVEGFAVHRDGWSSDEKNLLDDMQWLSLEQIRDIEKRDRIYPESLPNLLQKWLINGWDGRCVKIDEYND